MLRVFCHLALWLRSSPPVTGIVESGLESANDLSDLMSADLLQLGGCSTESNDISVYQPSLPSWEVHFLRKRQKFSDAL